MRLQQMEVSCETKTKDNVFVLIRVAVQYQVRTEDESIQNAHYRLTNAGKQIESYVFDVVRSSVPKIEPDDVFTTKGGDCALDQDQPRGVDGDVWLR